MMKNLYIHRYRSIRFKIYTFMVITVKDLYITRFRSIPLKFTIKNACIHPSRSIRFEDVSNPTLTCGLDDG
ncbi:unnamed protein product [Rotaria magnacalcarata]|uniref:Uncharacterized protein n=1 Tax=Rotaria magnacalcarata TaxID=392030 RepID=A0A819EQA4_9BILA|nr:unnamed protein product [Rotaria magnacalcarata]